jgi:preprotein translocase subunit SecG
MQTLIIVVHLMIVLAMIGVVLLQKSEGGGLGIGSSGGFMSTRGTANVLSRTTAILAACFFATSLVLSIIAGMHRHPGSILQPTSGPSVPVSGSPSAPASGEPSGGAGGGVLDQLRQREQQGGAPQGGPQVTQSK